MTKRDAVAARLRAAGVETGVHYSPPLHRQPALRGLAVASGDLPRAEAWAREELSLAHVAGLSRVEVETAARGLRRGGRARALKGSLDLEPA